MHLKVFAVPILVVAILILSIGYIWPGISDMEMKKIQLESKLAELSNVETIMKNIDSLNASLDSQQETEQFVLRYLPKSMDQDRAIDSFNFLAAQSGLTVTNMKMENVERVVTAAPVAEEPVAGAPVVESVVSDPVAETYIASVYVRGSYENIKGFFDRVSHMDRLHKVSLLSIATEETNPVDGSAQGSGDLIGIFKARFEYFPERSVMAAVSVPVFRQSAIDFSSVKETFGKISNSITLDRPETGRPNPFQ